MSKRKDWTDTEQQAICMAWLGMLTGDLIGQAYNKSAIRRELRGTDDNPGPLFARSNGSVEAKLMNVSAAAQAIGLPIVKGYKPASNYQASLRLHLAECLSHMEFLRDLLEQQKSERRASC